MVLPDHTLVVILTNSKVCFASLVPGSSSLVFFFFAGEEPGYKATFCFVYSYQHMYAHAVLLSTVMVTVACALV